MKQAAIFMSDFHLGQKDRLEEFFADEEFSELLGRLSRLHAEDTVDLVLVGDVIDLWTTSVHPEEQNAEKASEVPLYFPARTDEARQRALTEEEHKVAAITAAHPMFFEALGLFLADEPSKRQIIYLAGNHDHSIVAERLQAMIRRSLLTPAVMTRLKGTQCDPETLLARLTFGYWYQNDHLQVYAEHGNQLTYGGIFRYRQVDQFGEECPGYFQFKLVSNRMERRAPELDSVFMGTFQPAMWPGILWWLLVKGHFVAFHALGTFQRQYEEDTRPGVAEARKALPSPWRTMWHLLKSRWLSLTNDEFGDKVLKLFDPNQQEIRPLSGQPLDSLETKTVILGHSHQPRNITLPGLEGVKYFNTGGWLMRFENGRQVIEETWVTISRDLPDETQMAPGRRIMLDRDMIQRRVERAHRARSPVTSDGRALNPVMREMQDLQVGDVLLFRWNFGATIWRLITQLHLVQLTRELRAMVPAWFNRRGTNSAWNHAALVYASPTEIEESDAYNDPLILEAVPDEGVGIHGPQHYLECPTDWDMAVLRLKAPWLHDPREGWRHRRLVRRLALGNLQAHYDTSRIVNQSLFEIIRSMDQRGKSLVGGLLKGALAGLVLGAVLLILRGLVLFMGRKESIHEWPQTFKQSLTESWEYAIGRLDDSHLIPLFQWKDVLTFFKEGDLWLTLTGVTITVGLATVVGLAILGTITVLVRIWLLVNTAHCAFWGGLLIPPLAELAQGWRDRTTFTRWSVTILWLGIPVSFLILSAALVTSGGILAGICHDPSACKWLGIELIAASWFIGIMLVVLCTPVLIWLCEGIVTLVRVSIVSPSREAHRRITVWRQGAIPKEPEPLPRQPAFICSTLVQYALVRTAQLATNSKTPGEVDASPPWYQYLPKHFAASDKFDWIYILGQGLLTYHPSPSHVAQVSPPLKDIESGELVWQARWSLLTALGSVCLMFMADYSKISRCAGTLINCWEPAVLGSLAGGLTLGLVALLLGQQAKHRLARDPEKQGKVLVGWSTLVTIVALLGSGLVFHDRAL